MPNQDQAVTSYNPELPEDQAQQESFQWLALSGEDQESYDALNLPSNHPHTMAQALLAQLKRMPLLEQQAHEQRLDSPEPMALLA